VAVNVWYHVGSKNEKPGKTGFAHLFEHLMFNGSENFNDDYFQALEKIGGTDLNGTTNRDRTNYFQNVPVSALDQVLWLESDRMGHLLGAIDQAKLDEQRGVVQNEKRQGENQPYGMQFDYLTKAMFPKGHPYSWTVIGEMEDLNAASLEDVKEWFSNYYGAANAVLSIAGDVEPEEAYQKVLKFFGDIPSGPTVMRQSVNIPRRFTDTRQVYQDRVPQVRIVRSWNTPEYGSEEDAYFDLIASILSNGKNSRMYKKLIYEDQVASSANAYQSSSEIASNFVMQVDVKPNQSAEEVESAMEAILAAFIENGPTQEELLRAKSSYFSGFIKGIERIGGFGGKSDILASNEVYFGDPEHYKKVHKWVANATKEDLVKTAKKWLSQGSHTLICEPFPKYSTVASEVDRSQGLPELGEPATSRFPDLQKTTLANGLEVVLARRQGVPTMQMRMIFDAGYATDIDGKAGTAQLAMNMLDEGTSKMSSLEINEQLQILGASLSTYSDLDASYVSMSTLKPTFQQSLDLMAEVLMDPAFPEKEFERLRDQQLNNIQQQQANPVQMALRTFPKYLYGEGHPYSLPYTGSGYLETVREMTRDDVLAYYRDWIKPNNAKLMVVGDISLEELKPQLEGRFGRWEKGDIPQKDLAAVDPSSNQGKLYLMDRPESQQSVIMGGYLVDPYGQVNEVANEAMNKILGGEFTSRLNMNLREDKHWAYGAFTLMLDAEGQRPFIAYAPVQTDKTAESAAEIIKEFEMFVGDQPVTTEEFEKSTGNTILQLPGRWETNSAVMSDLTEQIKYGLADDYFQQYDEMVRGLSVEEIQQLGKKMVDAQKLTFFVVGDKEKVLPRLQEMGFKEIILVDGDGNPIESGKASKP
jgi:predicted Zn-dependent peptidase